MSVAALPWIMAAMTTATAVVSAVGAVKQGQATAAADDFNARIQQQNANTTLAQGDEADAMLKKQQEQRMGAAIAAFGASGTDLSSGSPSDVLADSARSAMLDRLTQKYNYRMKALGYQTEGSVSKAAGDNASTAGYLAGLGALGQGASNIAGL